MNRRPMLLVSAATLGAMFLVSAWAWTQLPPDAQVPIHWGVDGQPDDWADKTVGLFLLPLIATGVAVLLAASCSCSAACTCSPSAWRSARRST